MTHLRTHHCRIWAALTISVVAGITGCSSSTEAPTALAQPAPSAQHAAGHTTAAAPAGSTPSAGKAAYCAPLAAALKVKPPSGQSMEFDALKNYGKLLKPAAAAASAAGKKDVAAFLDVTADMSLAGPKMTGKQAEAAFAGMAKAGPIIFKDCGIDISK